MWKRPGKNTEMIVQFLKNLSLGKRILWLSPKYVIMDWASWEDLKAEAAKSGNIVVWDEVSNMKDEDWGALLKILDKAGKNVAKT